MVEHCPALHTSVGILLIGSAGLLIRQELPSLFLGNNPATIVEVTFEIDGRNVLITYTHKHPETQKVAMPSHLEWVLWIKTKLHIHVVNNANN